MFQHAGLVKNVAVTSQPRDQPEEESKVGILCRLTNSEKSTRSVKNENKNKDNLILCSVTLTKTLVCIKTCFSSVTEPPATQIGAENPFSSFPASLF